MPDGDLSEILRREEAKRAANTDTVEHWRTIWENLNWAESQLPIPRNSKEASMAKERRILEGMSKRQSGLSQD